jgi:hypothetical protein
VTSLFLGHERFAFPRRSGVTSSRASRRAEFTCRKSIREWLPVRFLVNGKTAVDGAVSGKDPARRAELRIVFKTDYEKRARLQTELVELLKGQAILWNLLYK